MNEEARVNDGKEGENGHMLGTWVTWCFNLIDCF